MDRKKVAEVIRENWERRNTREGAVELGKCVDQLRFRHGLNYKQSLGYFRSAVSPLEITEAEYEEVMQAVDEAESHS